MWIFKNDVIMGYIPAIPETELKGFIQTLLTTIKNLYATNTVKDS